MEQETLFIQASPRKVRRQLCFLTPSKKIKLFDTRTEEIQKTPKCKLSKSKVIEKISKNKVVIDFNIEKNYFLDEIDTSAYFQGEERDAYQAKIDQLLFGANMPSFHFASPLKTAKKPRLASSNFSDFSSVVKESRRGNSFGESPFCQLLNESDRFTVDKYQTLGGNELEDNSDELKNNYCSQIQLVDTFFQFFQQRSSGIMDLFVQDAVFEILGEERIHSLNLTLNALAKVFLNFECELGSGFNYKFAASDNDNEIIISTTGKLVSRGFQPDFIISIKISLDQNLINYVKLKLC